MVKTVPIVGGMIGRAEKEEKWLVVLVFVRQGGWWNGIS